MCCSSRRRASATSSAASAHGSPRAVRSFRQHGRGRQDADPAGERARGLGLRRRDLSAGVVRTVARTAEDFYGSLKAHGSTAPFRARMFDFDALNQLIGTPEMLRARQALCRARSRNPAARFGAAMRSSRSRALSTQSPLSGRREAANEEFSISSLRMRASSARTRPEWTVSTSASRTARWRGSRRKSAPRTRARCSTPKSFWLSPAASMPTCMSASTGRWPRTR